MEISHLIVLSSLLVTLGLLGTTEAEPKDLSAIVNSVYQKHNVPALGGLWLNSTTIGGIGTAGFRRRGYAVPVTNNDHWHIGSCTKAMTATMIARLVELGRVKWTDTVGASFPTLGLPEKLFRVNYLHLLSHRSGIPGNANWGALAGSAPTLSGQRLNAIKALKEVELLEPGNQHIYSNWGIVVAATMAEAATGQTYEQLMSELVFGPLGMESSVGYGPTSRSDEMTHPWGHSSTGVPSQGDNPLVMSPAGTVHVSMQDWAKYIQDQLRGAMGLQGLLKPETYAILHTEPFVGNGYGLGWVIGRIDWAKGFVLHHNGSNTSNYAWVIIDPIGGIAVLAVCNQAEHGPVSDVISAFAAIAHKERQAM